MVYGIKVKCPICGEERNIKELGLIRVDGLDPMMKGYECLNIMHEFGNGDDWLKIISSAKCNTVFYIAPKPAAIITK